MWIGDLINLNKEFFIYKIKSNIFKLKQQKKVFDKEIYVKINS